MNIIPQQNRLLEAVLFCILMCSTITVNASEYQSHKSIYLAAENYVQKNVEPDQKHTKTVEVGTLDSRLKLRKCNQSLQAFMPSGSRKQGKTTVGVKCTGSKPWSLHVPVEIKIYKNVLAATRALRKGDVLTEADIKLVRYDISSLSYGYFEKMKTGVGMKVKRHVTADTVLTPSMIKKPDVITRGQKVSILASSGRMQVRMMGKALSNGAVGERIKVLNMKSKQKIEGVVTALAEIEVEI